MAPLSTTVGNAAAIRDALRRKMGHPNDTVLLPDGTVDDAVREALSALNSRRPVIGIGTFTTIAGQQAYTPLPADAYGLRNVFWGGGGSDCLAQRAGLLLELDPLLGPADALGNRFAPEPGAVLAVERQRAWLRKLTGTGVHLVDGAAYLMPVPQDGGDVVLFSYHAPRYATAGAVAERDAPAFWVRAEAELHRVLAAGAGAVTEVADTSEGTRISTKAPEHHLKLAADLEAKFLRMTPPPVFGAFP